MKRPETRAEIMAEREASAERIRIADERRIGAASRMRTVSHALRRYFATRSAWEAPKALPLEVESGAPSRGADSLSRVVFAATARGIKLAVQAELELAADECRMPAPLDRWLYESHHNGRAYSWIAEEYGISESLLKRRMSKAHRVIGEWLERAGVLDVEER